MDDDLWKELLLSSQAYLTVAAVAVVIAFIAFAASASFRRRRLPLPRLRIGRWGGREVVLAVLTQAVFAPFIVLTILASTQLGSLPERTDRTALRETSARLSILGSPLIVALTLAIIITVLFTISGTRPHHLGVTRSRWTANVLLGALLFLAMTPLALATYFLAGWILGNEEKNILELLVRNGIAWWEWALLVFTTVIGAPVMEEIVYRGVLQGWLHRASLLGHVGLMLAVLACGSLPLASYLFPGRLDSSTPNLADALGPFFFSIVLIAGHAIWLMVLRLRVPRDAYGAEVQPAAQQDSRWANARLSVYGAATLFAIVHPWPTPIPLLLFGLAVGWLAHRTQSLIGGMVCHALFNSVACFVLYWGTAS